MGQKVSPHGLRVGINRDWDSRWFAKKSDYYRFLHEDIKIRQCCHEFWNNANVANIEIERKSPQDIVIIVNTSRPQVVLGQRGKNIEIITKKLRTILHNRQQKFQIRVIEIKDLYLNAQMVANTIAQQISNRASFRIAQKLAIKKALNAGALGVKTIVSGRLGGVDMARSEGYLEGQMKLSTLRSNIDYAKTEAFTTYGQIGVKVWISRGEFLDHKLHLKNENNVKMRNMRQRGGAKRRNNRHHNPRSSRPRGER